MDRVLRPVPLLITGGVEKYPLLPSKARVEAPVIGPLLTGVTDPKIEPWGALEGSVETRDDVLDRLSSG